MDSGDEAFENIIEVDGCEANVDCDEHDDSDKENSTNSGHQVARGRQVKPTKQTQIDKIVAFVKENNAQIIEKSVYASMWDTLTKELNNLGPAINSTKKWKRIWSVYKYNNRSRMSAIFAAARQDEPSSSTRQPDQLSVVTEDHWNSQMSKVLKQQEIIINTLDKRTSIIQRLCHLLEEISKKK